MMYIVSLVSSTSINVFLLDWSLFNYVSCILCPLQALATNHIWVLMDDIHDNALHHEQASHHHRLDM